MLNLVCLFSKHIFEGQRFFFKLAIFTHLLSDPMHPFPGDNVFYKVESTLPAVTFDSKVRHLPCLPPSFYSRELMHRFALRSILFCFAKDSFLFSKVMRLLRKFRVLLQKLHGFTTKIIFFSYENDYHGPL